MTITIFLCSSSCLILSTSILFRRALPYTEVVCIATWNAFREIAGTLREFIAIAISDTDICSPIVKSISISLLGGFSFTCLAISISSSVYLPIADRTTTTSFPFCQSSIHLLATLKILSVFPTEVPPNFFTINILSS